MYADMTAVTIQSNKIVSDERQLSTTRAIIWKKPNELLANPIFNGFGITVFFMSLWDAMDILPKKEHFYT